MSIFDEYISKIPAEQRVVLERIINLVAPHVPEAREGYSYGFPAFKYAGRPLLGFGYKEEVFSLYPFDPKIIEAIRPVSSDYEVGKGYIRFTAKRPVAEDVVLAMVDLRLDYLKSRAS